MVCECKKPLSIAIISFKFKVSPVNSGYFFIPLGSALPELGFFRAVWEMAARVPSCHSPH